MSSVSIKVILSDRKEVLKWQIHPVTKNISLYNFFCLLVTGKISPEVFINKDYLDFLLKVKVKNSLKREFVNVNIQCELNEILQDLVTWIKNNGGGWKERLIADSIGKTFINDLLYSIWYVDTCGIEKMKGRVIHLSKELEEFFNRSDPSSYKNARPKFDYDCLDQHANLLFGYLNALIDDLINVKIYDRIWVFSNSHTKLKYKSLNNKLSTLPFWEVLDIEPFVPPKLSKKYTFIHNLPKNICQKFGIFQYSSSNNAFHTCFLWCVDESLDEEEIISKSYAISNWLKSEMPIYHTQFMHTQFKYKADLILGIPTKYHQQLLISENDKIIVDLRSQNKGRPEQYAEFWNYVKQYLEDHAAVDDRRHGTVVHLSHAISVRDLVAQVAKICPSDTPIPSK
ncbi:hypothetical protein C1645_832418 [Glomus cerebriforme]|uniref:Uncharacterized protein n=1 Tax=Glomus cerebriforme TaxID=658196 RepID=A0A397SJN2_9GLOM|nr:hypothetical protein C1645_832418 [Glomus cerebriforme]